MVQKVGNVIARTEDVRLTLNHHHAHRRVGRCAAERIGERSVHRGGDGVLFVGAIESQREDAAFGVLQDVLGHLLIVLQSPSQPQRGLNHHELLSGEVLGFVL